MDVETIFSVQTLLGVAAVTAVFIVCMFPGKNGSGLVAAYLFTVFATGITVYSVAGADIRIELPAMVLLLALSILSRSWHSTDAPSVWEAGQKTNRFPHPVVFGLLWVVVLAVSSLAFAPAPDKSLWMAVQVGSGAIAYWIVSELRHTTKVLMVQIGTLLLGAFSAGSMILLGVALLAPLPTTNIGVASDLRLIGLSIEVNIFAATLVSWLPLAILWRGYLSAPKYKISLFVIVVGILLAATRSAWVSLMLVVIVWLASSARNGRNLSRIVVGVTIVGAGLAIVWSIGAFQATGNYDNNSILWRATNIFNFSQGTGAYRASIYDTAWREISSSAERLLFGSGANSYSQFHLADFTDTGASYLSSIWVATPYDSGVLGSCLLLLFLAAVVARSASVSGAVLLVATLLLCATTTNSIWLAFPWVYLGLVPERSASRVPIRVGRSHRTTYV